MLAFVALFALACGANEAPRGGPPETPEDEPEAADLDPAPGPEPEVEPAVQAEPEIEPVEIEAGVRLGPIRIGMSEAEVRALGLDEQEVDPRSRRFGPYRVYLGDGEVVRVEAQIGALERIRFGATVIDAGTHIHTIRDAFGNCEWTEGGGERYVCAGGSLSVQTTHSMDPQRYTLGVERR